MLLYLYPIEKRLTFKKEERLKSHKLIEQLFTNGKSYSIYPIKALYQFTELKGEVCLQTGVAVSKRNFKKAVDRNRIKRLLREACRLEKNGIETSLKSGNRQLAIFLIFTGKELPAMSEIMEKVKVILLALDKLIKDN